MWAKIGVEATIKPFERLIWSDHVHNKTYNNAITYRVHTGNPVDTMVRFGESGHRFNFPMWENERYDELMALLVQEIEESERNIIIKEAAAIFRDAVSFIPTSVDGGGRTVWWPWLKNYYGEINAGDQDFFTIIAHCWVDQDLKISMSY